MKHFVVTFTLLISFFVSGCLIDDDGLITDNVDDLFEPILKFEAKVEDTLAYLPRATIAKIKNVRAALVWMNRGPHEYLSFNTVDLGALKSNYTAMNSLSFIKNKVNRVTEAWSVPFGKIWFYSDQNGDQKLDLESIIPPLIDSINLEYEKHFGRIDSLKESVVLSKNQKAKKYQIQIDSVSQVLGIDDFTIKLMNWNGFSKGKWLSILKSVFELNTPLESFMQSRFLSRVADDDCIQNRNGWRCTSYIQSRWKSFDVELFKEILEQRIVLEELKRFKNTNKSKFENFPFAVDTTKDFVIANTPNSHILFFNEKSELDYALLSMKIAGAPVLYDAPPLLGYLVMTCELYNCSVNKMGDTLVLEHVYEWSQVIPPLQYDHLTKSELNDSITQQSKQGVYGQDTSVHFLEVVLDGEALWLNEIKKNKKYKDWQKLKISRVQDSLKYWTGVNSNEEFLFSKVNGSMVLTKLLRNSSNQHFKKQKNMNLTSIKGWWQENSETWQEKKYFSVVDSKNENYLWESSKVGFHWWGPWVENNPIDLQMSDDGKLISDDYFFKLKIDSFNHNVYRYEVERAGGKSYFWPSVERRLSATEYFMKPAWGEHNQKIASQTLGVQKKSNRNCKDQTTLTGLNEKGEFYTKSSFVLELESGKERVSSILLLFCAINNKSRNIAVEIYQGASNSRVLFYPKQFVKIKDGVGRLEINPVVFDVNNKPIEVVVHYSNEYGEVWMDEITIKEFVL